ncbi:ferric enterobactin receptor [Hymenobacter sp. UYAg731]
MPSFYPSRSGSAAGGFYSLLLAGTIYLTPLAGQAQSRSTLSGTVQNSTGAPVEFATVTLHRAADSVVVKSELSDAQGRFQLEAAAGGSYRILVAQVGFARYWSPVYALPAAGLAVSAIRLTTSQASALKEVTVTTRKPLFEHLADRTVVNVADSPLAAGATALEVLTRAPGVTQDGADNLGLRGRSGVLVVMDGKRVPLTGTELTDYLKALPAEQLQRIDLITNPPAQYDAQGGAGVIDIHLKKDQRLGTNGSANASYGRGEYGKFTGGFALNHRRKSLNLYGNYAYTDRHGFVRVDFNRQFAATSLLPAASSVQANEQLSWLRSHSSKIGLDLTLSKRTQLGISATGLASQTNTATTNQTQLYGASGEGADHYSATVAQDINRPNGSANLNLRHAFADSATAASLTVDADYARYHTTRLMVLNTYFDAPALPSTLLTGDQRNNLSIGAAKVDFSMPLPRRIRLEAGAKVTRVQTDNAAIFWSDGAFNSALSNSFQYRENVNAAYVTLSRAAAKTTWQAGLRAEQTNTQADFAGEASRERHYLNLFPSATVQRTLSARHALGLAVARRIDRPNYAQLNPLRAYLDATSYSAGNPDLVAQTSYSAELTHTYRQKFVTALAYARTHQPIVNVVQPAPDGGRLVVNRNVNLNTLHNYSLTLTAPLELRKWWTVYANGTVYYARYVGSLAGTALDRGQLACTLTANNSFTIPGGWSAEVTGLYESREVYGFEVIRPRSQVSAGLQKSIWNKQGTLRLNAADIFYTTPLRITSTYDNFVETFYTRQDTRVVTAAFTYRFGNSKVAAARKRAAGADEELRRAAGQ